MFPWLYRALFWTLVRIGRPVRGLRPRRVYRWIAERGYPRFATDDTRWRVDRLGNQLLLNPYYHIDRDIIICGAYDWPLHRAIARIVKRGDVCLDVGANIGSVTLDLARRVGRQGKVHSFEPNPIVVERLREHIVRNALDQIVQIHPTALSNVSGETQIRTPKRCADNQGTSSLVNRSDKTLSITRKVPTTTLDEFVRENDISRINFIKLDIQGAEPLLLQGGQRTLSRFSPTLIMEVSPDDLSSLGMKSCDLLQLVDSLDYKIYELKARGFGKRIHASEFAAEGVGRNVYCSKN